MNLWDSDNLIGIDTLINRLKSIRDFLKFKISIDDFSKTDSVWSQN